MQHIKKILELPILSGSQTTAKANPQKTTSLPSNGEVRSESKRIDVLFAKFAAFYGHIWRSQFKDEFLVFAKKEWREGLFEFSNEVLMKAIQNCKTFYEMPPTLPQMMLCCRQIKKQSMPVMDSITNVPASSEVAEFNLQRCKAILGSITRRKTCWY